MWAVAALAWWVALQGPVAPAPLAVLPLKVSSADADNIGPLLTAALTARLQALGDYRVLSADDVAEMMANEQDRQGAGCSDADCLAELAGALGARFVVQGELVRTPSGWLMSTALLDTADATVKGRSHVAGSSAQALLSQAQEVALQLVGRGDEAKLAGPAARERLGLTRDEDLAEFRSFREKRPEMSTDEALTRFIVDRNRESDALAWGEFAAFGTAAGLVLTMIVTGFTGYLAFVSLYQPAIMAASAVGALCLGLGAVVAGGTGLVLAIVDAFNIGRVKVRGRGCCRQDPDIRDAERRDGAQLAAALGILLSGPISSTFMAFGYMFFGMTIAAASLTGLGRSQYNLYTSADYAQDPLANLANTLFFIGFACTVPLTCCPLLFATPAGAALLLWPSRPFVEADDAPVRPQPARPRAPTAGPDGDAGADSDESDEEDAP